MKAVLMSIRPEWCELIASGKKTVEIRKTIPRKFVHGRFYDGYITEPFKVYIYETQGYSATPQVFEDGTTIFRGRGKVIGEFMCDRILPEPEVAARLVDFVLERTSCTKPAEIVQYANGTLIYSWHISDLVIYDKPKELSDFCIQCKEYDKDRPQCGKCEYYYYESNESIGFYDECGCDGLRNITRPPQSWCYVEVV